MDWNALNVIEHSVVVSKFQGNRFFEKENLKKNHLYIPWQETHIDDLMFQFKKIIAEKGSCYIPVMQKDLAPGLLTDSVFDSLLKQLSIGVETHLYMSNLDSIHVWKIKKIYQTEKMNTDEIKTCPHFDKNNFYQWIEVEDLFVLKANHMGTKEDVMEELERISATSLMDDIFMSLNRFHSFRDSYNQKWVHLKRNVTYDYFIRGQDLKENIYPEVWKALARLSQHYLIMSDQCRHQAIALQNDEKSLLLNEAFNYYVSATLSELNEIYIYPLCDLYFTYDSIKDAWGEIESSTNLQMKEILKKLFKSNDVGIDNLKDFLNYIRFSKSLLFSLKSKFAKKIGKEEFLIIENALIRQENLIDAFGYKNLNKKISNLVKIQNSFELGEGNFDGLKFTHILSLLSSASYQDNLFFPIIEEKTAKGISKKCLEEEIDQLLNNKPLRLAA